jgi:hypothetical protein
LSAIGFYERHPELANATFVGSLIRRGQAQGAVLGAVG